MAKLLTPTQYEPALEGLNALRPLSVGTHIKLDITYPVLCTNAIAKDRPVLGTSARCTPTGALLKNEVVFADEYEYIIHTISDTDQYKVCAFSQEVFGVLVKAEETSGTGFYYWTNNDWTIRLKLLTADVWFYIPFVGENFYIERVFMTSGGAYMHYFGFYK